MATAYVCPRRCNCRKTEFSCSHRQLDSIPELPAKVQVVRLQENNITRVMLQDFAGCKELLTVNLTSNRIAHIDSGTFSGNPNLTNLYLASNLLNFSTLSSGIFENMSNLQALTVNNNKWKHNGEYRGDIFGGLTSLRKLCIDGLPDVKFPSEFSNLRNLHDLRVYGGLNLISNDTFEAFRYSRIKWLSVNAGRHLYDVELMSFKHFSSLTSLNIHDTVNLGLANVSKAWYGLPSTKITVLFLSGINPIRAGGEILTGDFFRYLNLTRIESLTLIKNCVASIAPSFAVSLPHLKYLNLQQNQLYFSDLLMMDLANLKNLQFINLDHQFFKPSNYKPFVNDALAMRDFEVGHPGEDNSAGIGSTLPTFHSKQTCRNGTWNKAQTNDYIHRSEHLAEIATICVVFGPSLQTINLRDSLRLNKQVLPPITVIGGRSLTTIRLTMNGLWKIYGPIIFQEPGKGIEIDLSRNKLQWISEESLRWSAGNVTALQMSENSLGDQLQSDNTGSTFEYLRTLVVLNLGYNGIKSLPQNVFANLSLLKTLGLDGNSLKTIDFTFDHMLHLAYLNLSDNLITLLSNSLLRDLSRSIERNQNMKINLNRNPLQCSCDTLDMLRWLSSNKGNMENFADNSCFYGTRFVNFSTLSDHVLPELEFQCSKPTAVLVAGILFGLTLVLVSMSACCYRHRWEIRYACLKLTQLGQRYQQLINQSVEYEFDAFVVYNIEDRQWVNDQLVPRLENRTVELEETSGESNINPAVRLCVHERDFPPGQEIIANIWNKMERSRKVILVISKNFSASHYCEYEMNLARMQSAEVGRNVLVPIILDWPAAGTVTECLSWVLRKLTYIEWPHSETEQDDFWQNLREALATNGDLR